MGTNVIACPYACPVALLHQIILQLLQMTPMKKLILLTLTVVLYMHSAHSQPVVTVWGSEDSLTIKKQVALYLEQLDVREQVYLTVVFTSQMPEKLEGITLCVNPSASNAYQFIKVKINARLGEKQRELVLAHEMVHVKQYTKGELTVNSDQQVIWKGRKYFYQPAARQHLPWENEAYQQDNQLTIQWKEYLKNSLNMEAPLTASKTNP